MEATANEATGILKRNILILGRTGTGKRSIANQILDKHHFIVGSSMESAAMNVCSEDVDFTDEKCKIHYNIKIIDTGGLSSTVVDEKTILHQIQDYYTNRVPEGVNLIIFTIRKDEYNAPQEIEVFQTILEDFKDEIREISALVVTRCEGLNEIGKQIVIQGIQKDPNTKRLFSYMGKGIHPVGFPVPENTIPRMKEALEESIASDATMMRELALRAELRISQQNIIRKTFEPMKHFGRSEKSGDHLQYLGFGGPKQPKFEVVADQAMVQKRNLVILGRTGTGKKSIANQVIDKKHFHVGSSMKSVTRDARTEEVEVNDKKRKVHYNIKIIDTVGPYSTVIDKKTIFSQIQDYSMHKVPEGVNLIIFTIRKDVYNTEEEIQAFKTILRDFKYEIEEISALVVTGCEGLDEVGRQRVIQEIQTDRNLKAIAELMGKGIHPVGFPTLENSKPLLKETLAQGIASDAERLRQLVSKAGELNLQQSILKQKLQSIKFTGGRSEKGSEYSGSMSKSCRIM